MIDLDKIVRRRVRSARGDVLVLALTKEGILIGEPRRRKKYLIDYGTVFMTAVRVDVEAERRKNPIRKARRTKVTRGLLTT